MGLDGVELLLAVEDAFQIRIEDDEAGGVYTVGDLYNLVVTKLQGQDSTRCLTSAAFYRTRRGIIDTLGVDRRQVRPTTLLETILPRNGRRERWRRIQEALKLKLPDLQHPGWMQLTFLTIGVALTISQGSTEESGSAGSHYCSSLARRWRLVHTVVPTACHRLSVSRRNSG